MHRLVLPFSLIVAIFAGVTLAQMDSSNARSVQTASALGFCLKTGIGCSR